MDTLRSLRKKIRDKDEEIEYLRDCLWIKLGGKFYDTTPKHELEKTGKLAVDKFIKSLLTDS